MNKYVDDAKKGRVIWLKLKEIYCMDDDDTLVIIPYTNDEELVACSIDCLPQYMESYHINKALVVVSESVVIDQGKEYAITYVNMNENEVNQLIQYYRLVQFAENIKVISTEKPFGSCGIINKKGITTEEYVKNAIFI